MTKHFDTDLKIFFKVGLPLIIVGVTAATIGDSYSPPLLLVGVGITILGLVVAWLSSPSFPF